jgi:hypothetical protein
MLEKILKLLDGRKTITVGVLSAIVVWITAENWIDLLTAEMLMTILTLLGGGASVATHRMNKIVEVKVETPK